MRLIDADKIRYRDMSDGQVADGIWYTFREDIRKQPTIKAIPLEWLKENTIKYGCFVFTLNNMIKDWEKENANV